MIGINAFEDHLNALIARAKANTSLSHMTDEEGNLASWDSKIWVYTNEHHQSANLLFTVEAKQGGVLSSYKHIAALPSPLREVIMLYALRVIAKDTGVVNKQVCVSIARNILARVNDIENLNYQQLKEYAKGKTKPHIAIANDFIHFLNNTVLQYNPLRKLKNSESTKTGEEIEIAQKKKLPDEKCIAALGAITYDTIPLKKARWKTGSQELQRDAFICTMAALAMGAPNRLAAEQTVLDAQNLQKHTEIINGKEEVVHFLNWKGSKGYKNNQNHIISSMSECIERCLDYMLKATDPMRVLAKFYTEPSAPLKSILRKKDCDPKKWQRAKPDLNEPINMIKLGYLLGLYNEGAKIQVIKGTEGAYKENPNTRNSIYIKPVERINNDDVLQITNYSIGDFIGLHRSTRSVLARALGLSGQVPLINVQTTWISYIKKIHPAFPEMRNRTKKGVCDARTMLFALSGKQLKVGAGGSVPGEFSNFFPVNPKTLGEIFSSEISPPENKRKSIFMRHGFSTEFLIRPHQFRHYINHTAFESGVPKLIINLWSGRKDPTQILHYIHTSDADQANMVSDIMFSEGVFDIEQAKSQIRLYSQQEYNELTGSIASETSSGICTQALHIMPCEYLNDFETQCLFCEKSCHVAHDDEAITLLNKDLKYQQQRLEQVANFSQFTVSKASQSWYKVHSQHTEILTQLLALMKDKDIPEGSLIRLLSTQSEFRITNLKTQNIEIKQLSLPDADREIARIISKKSADDNSNDVVNELLELI